MAKISNFLQRKYVPINVIGISDVFVVTRGRRRLGVVTAGVLFRK